MVFTDCGRGLVQEVAADIGDARVNLLDTGFRLLPVAAELRFARHGTLVACKPLLVLSEGVEGSMWLPSDRVAKRVIPTSMPMMLVAGCTGCSTSRRSGCSRTTCRHWPIP